MAEQFFGRKLVDDNGNAYVVDIPHDVNPDNLEDILIGANEGIVKLRAYKLRDDIYRLPNTMPMGDEHSRYKSTAYKRLSVSEQTTVSQEEFGKAIQEMLERYKQEASKFGRPRVSTWSGHKVHVTENGVHYIEREIQCAATGCTSIIKGRLPLDFDDDGKYLRCQKFKPYDKRSQRVRAGSKHWFCADCAVKSIDLESLIAPAKPFPVFEVLQQKVIEPVPVVEPAPVPELEESVVTHVVKLPESTKSTNPATEATPRIRSENGIFEVMLDMSKPGAGTDPTYFIGFVHGALLMRKEKGS